MVLSRCTVLIPIALMFASFVSSPSAWPTQTIRCSEHASAPGPTRIEVSIPRGFVDPAGIQKIRDLLKVSVQCLGAEYDPVTDQARWSYEVVLGNNDPTGMHSIHLTHLWRTLERTIGETKDVELEDFTLDVLRADLHVNAGQKLSFPCSESLGRPRLAGDYTVHRSYAGDLTVKGSDGAVRYIPLKVVFAVNFALPQLTGAVPNDEARERAPRRLEWAWLSDRCETCRPTIICESLARTGPLPPDPQPPNPPSFQKSTTTYVHVVAGVEKRPVIVDSSLAERKRTVACTRWSPLPGASLDGNCWIREGAGTTLPAGRGLIQTDSTERGMVGAAYLLFHHAAPTKCMSTGSWRVELLLGEIMDNWRGFYQLGDQPDGRWTAWQAKLVEACLLDPKPWTATFEVR